MVSRGMILIYSKSVYGIILLPTICVLQNYLNTYAVDIRFLTGIAYTKIFYVLLELGTVICINKEGTIPV